MSHREILNRKCFELTASLLAADRASRLVRKVKLLPMLMLSPFASKERQSLCQIPNLTAIKTSLSLNFKL